MNMIYYVFNIFHNPLLISWIVIIYIKYIKMSDFYNLRAELPSWEKVSMSDYKWKVILIVNTASKCGLVGQYAWLETLYKKYKDKWLVVLWFPCNQFANQEPLKSKDIKTECLINYGVTFPIFKKIDVNGKNASEIFTYLKKQNWSIFWTRIKWNFTKFLISRDGESVKRFAPIVKPEKMEEDIIKLIG